MCAEPYRNDPTGKVERRLLTVTEAAQFLRVEPADVARAIRRGQVPAITVDGLLMVDGQTLVESMREPYDGV